MDSKRFNRLAFRVAAYNGVIAARMHAARSKTTGTAQAAPAGATVMASDQNSLQGSEIGYLFSFGKGGDGG